MTDFNELVEAAAKAIAEADGWDWHDDEYRPLDPKWQPTDKAEYRKTARAALTVANVPQLLAERESLERALKFYADPETYFAIGMIGDPPHGPFLDDLSDEHDPGYPKPGKRARAALSGEKP